FIPHLVDRESSFDPQGQPVRKIQPRASTGRVQAAGAVAVFKIVDFARIGERVELSPPNKAAVGGQHFGTQFRRAQRAFVTRPLTISIGAAKIGTTNGNLVDCEDRRAGKLPRSRKTRAEWSEKIAGPVCPGIKGSELAIGTNP